MDTNIKNAPPRIYLNLGNLPPGEFEFANLHEVSWCADKQDVSDIEYVLAALAPASAARAPNKQGAYQRAVDVGGKVIPAYGERGDMVALYADQLEAIYGATVVPSDAAPAALSGIALLADDHKGMRVDYSGLFKQARVALARAAKEPALAEMLRQLQDHITELGTRWYAGDTAVVDELLQLYCVEKGARDALLAATHVAPAAHDAVQAPLTVAQRDSIWVAAEALEKSDQHVHAAELRALLAAPVASAAAPRDSRFTHPGCDVCACPPGGCQAEPANCTEEAERVTARSEASEGDSHA